VAPDPDSDFEAEFFSGLSADAIEERQDLLAWLTEQGFSRNELLWGNRHGVLSFIAAGREIGGPRVFTREQIALKSGVDLDYWIRLRRAVGLPIPDAGEPALSELDLRVAVELHGWLKSGFEPEQLIAATRAIGSNLGRAAEAMRSALFDLVVLADASEKEIAATYAQTTAALLPLTDQLIVGLTRQHLRNIMQTELVGAIEIASGGHSGSQVLTVAFADLVGFTRLGEELPPEELGRVADQLLETAQELVAPPVRIVKTIGDAVMLVSDDPAELVDFGLNLCQAVSDRGPGFPQLRVGLATGHVVARAGDVFGAPVNLASRVAAAARAGSVLADASVQSECARDFSWSPAGVRRLKGIPRPVPLFRARPLR
jgi:adenylate cyclase